MGETFNSSLARFTWLFNESSTTALFGLGILPLAQDLDTKCQK